MPDTINEQKIREIVNKVQAATSVALLRTAEQMSVLAARETVELLKRMGYNLPPAEQKRVIDEVVSARIATYAAQLKKGGSDCVERVLTKLTNTKYLATTRVRFIKWLDDKNTKEADDIISLIRRETASNTHPYKIARMLDEVFEGTRHNSETVARTEASKIRNDTRFDVMRSQGVNYLRYVTAGDNRVRPEHHKRNGKIYPADRAPWMGEYNCRCVLVPADRDVMKGAPVTKTDAELIDISELR